MGIAPGRSKSESGTSIPGSGKNLLAAGALGALA